MKTILATVCAVVACGMHTDLVVSAQSQPQAPNNVMNDETRNPPASPQGNVPLSIPSNAAGLGHRHHELIRQQREAAVKEHGKECGCGWGGWGGSGWGGLGWGGLGWGGLGWGGLGCGCGGFGWGW